MQLDSETYSESLMSACSFLLETKPVPRTVCAKLAAAMTVEMILENFMIFAYDLWWRI